MRRDGLADMTTQVLKIEHFLHFQAVRWTFSGAHNPSTGSLRGSLLRSVQRSVKERKGPISLRPCFGSVRGNPLPEGMKRLRLQEVGFSRAGAGIFIYLYIVSKYFDPELVSDLAEYRLAENLVRHGAVCNVYGANYAEKLTMETLGPYFSI